MVDVKAGPHLQQHRGHERRWSSIDTTTHAVVGDVADRAGRGGVGAGDRPGDTIGSSSAARNNLMVMMDSTTGKVLGAACRSVPASTPTPSTRAPARLRVEQRRHADRGHGRCGRQAHRRADAGHAGAHADDDARPDDAPPVRGRGGVRGADRRSRWQAAASAGVPGSFKVVVYELARAAGH